MRISRLQSRREQTPAQSGKAISAHNDKYSTEIAVFFPFRPMSFMDPEGYVRYALSSSAGQSPNVNI